MKTVVAKLVFFDRRLLEKLANFGGKTQVRWPLFSHELDCSLAANKPPILFAVEDITITHLRVSQLSNRSGCHSRFE